MAADEKIYANEINKFSVFTRDIDRFCIDEDGTVYITTNYGVFKLDKKRILRLAFLYNESIKLYKVRKKILIKNKEEKEEGNQVASLNYLEGAKHLFDVHDSKQYIKSHEPFQLGPSKAKSPYRVSSEDFLISHVYKGQVINFVKLVLGSDIKYSTSNFELKSGIKGGILSAESKHGKVYVLSLQDTKEDEE